MADYKRQVSYMYLYEEGRKRNNIGYARVEAKNGQCKYTIHITALGLNERQLKVYTFRRRNSEIEGILLGTLLVKNNTGDFKVMTDTTHIMNSPYGLEDMGGIVVLFSERKFFATEWDSKPITMGMVTNINRKEERKPVKEVAKEVMKEVVTEARPVPEEQKDMKAADLAEVLFEYAKAPKEKAYTKSPKEEIKDEKSLKDLLTPNISIVLEEESNPDENPEEANTKSLIQIEEQTVISPEETTLAPIEVSDCVQEEETTIDIEQINIQDSVENTIELPLEEVEEVTLNAPEVEKGDVEKAIIIQKEEPEETQKEMNETQAKELDEALEEEQKESQEEMHEAQVIELDETLEEEQEESQEEIYVTWEDEQKESQEEIYVTWEDEQKESQEERYKTWEDEHKESQEEFYKTWEDEHKETQEESQEEVQEEIQEAWEETLKESQGERKEAEKENFQELGGRPIFDDHPLAKQIYHHFPKMYPFEDNEIAWCARIEPKDIGMLPMELWGLGNNSFLLHGYYSYRHLIFARVNDKTGQNYILGVPGIYHNREKFMAKMFGFENFKCAKRKPQRTGEFGYWYIPVLLNRQ